MLFKLFLSVTLFIDSDGAVDLSRLHCNLIQKFRPEIDGIGVFAGRNFTKGEVLERCIAFHHSELQTDHKLLGNYVFQHKNDGNVAVILGYAMVLTIYT